MGETAARKYRKPRGLCLLPSEKSAPVGSDLRTCHRFWTDYVQSGSNPKVRVADNPEVGWATQYKR